MKKSRTETEALARRPCPCPPASWRHGCSFRPIVRCSSDLAADSGHACPEAKAPGQTPRGAVVADHVATWHISCHTSDHQWWLQEGLIRNSMTRTLREQQLCEIHVKHGGALPPTLQTTLHNCPRRTPSVPPSLTLPEGLPAERCYVAGSQTPPCFLWVKNLRNLRKAGLGDITWLFGISPLLN